MPSIRFVVGVIHLAIVCLAGLRARDTITASAMPILFLCWTSLTADLLCYALFRNGLEFESVKHFYTLLEFLLEILFVSGVTKNVFLKRVVTFILPLYFAVWYFVQLDKNAVQQDDMIAQIISSLLVIAFIVWVLIELTSNLSESMKHESRKQLAYQAARQIWQPAIGKMFVGLVLFNIFVLVIYQLQMLGFLLHDQYYHSVAHILKNTCFLIAFLQIQKRG